MLKNWPTMICSTRFLVLLFLFPTIAQFWVHRQFYTEYGNRSGGAEHTRELFLQTENGNRFGLRRERLEFAGDSQTTSWARHRKQQIVMQQQLGKQSQNETTLVPQSATAGPVKKKPIWSSTYRPGDVPLDSPLRPRFLESNDRDFGFTPIPFFHRSTVNATNEGEPAITIVTQMSVDKWPRLLALAEQWSGPVSCAVFVKGSGERKELDNLLKSGEVPRKLDVHVLFLDSIRLKHFRDGDYPMNRLRNLALDYAGTQYVMPLDVDFLPSLYSHNKLLRHMKRIPDKLDLLVVPAFERFVPPTGIDNTTQIPSTKAALLKSIRMKESAPFHISTYEAGHGPTEYKRWYGIKDKLYRIKWRPKYEPYVVATRAGLPPYWDGFTGTLKTFIFAYQQH
jgi:Glycosyl-transferase for dystroglycan